MKIVALIGAMLMTLASLASPAESRPRHKEASTTQFVSHPEGCPRINFCGCGASVEIFGRPDRSLFLASNWFKFPRAEPGHNMVAVRRGHVFVLKEQVQGSVWRVYDANSGGRRTRIHHRSIAGFTIVNPTGGGGKYAEASF